MNERRNHIDLQSVHSVAHEAKEKIEAIGSIWRTVQACSGNYMCVRDSIKGVFDLLDDEKSEDYIGILEWAFAQEMADSCLIGNFDLRIENVLRRFFSNRDIRAMVEAGGSGSKDAR